MIRKLCRVVMNLEQVRLYSDFMMIKRASCSIQIVHVTLCPTLPLLAIYHPTIFFTSFFIKHCFYLFLSYYLSYQACISLFSVVIEEEEEEDTSILLFLYIILLSSFSCRFLLQSFFYLSL